MTKIIVCVKSSFEGSRYKLIGDGPIKSDTIVTLDAATGSLLDHWGSNLFYMPHGLEVDANGNTWVTDVALHQVFKVNWTGQHISMLVLFQMFAIIFSSPKVVTSQAWRWARPLSPDRMTNISANRLMWPSRRRASSSSRTVIATREYSNSTPMANCWIFIPVRSTFRTVSP